MRALKEVYDKLASMRQFAAVILVKPDGSVLAQHRDNIPSILGPDTWVAIGGARDKEDKDLKSVGVRELEEETGYKMLTKELRFLARDEYETEKGTPVERTIFWALYDGKQEIQCFEGQEIRFVESREFDALKFYTGHEKFFRKASEKVFTTGIEKK